MDLVRGKTVGFILVGLGAFFLLGQVFDLSDFTWPLFIIVPGLLLNEYEINILKITNCRLFFTLFLQTGMW